MTAKIVVDANELKRRRRLKNGCCPVHGIGMTQIGGDVDQDGEGYEIAACPRKDCSECWSIQHGSAVASMPPSTKRALTGRS